MGETSFTEEEIAAMENKVQVMADQIAVVASGIGTGATGIANSTHSTSPEERARLNNEYKAAWDTAKTTLADAPMELSQTEKNYYVYNGGNPNGNDIYDKLIIDRFATTAREFRINSIEMQQQFMADLSQALRQYQAEVTFLAQSQKLLKTRQSEHQSLIKNINYYQKILQTSERKVVYENKNMNSLYTYRRLMIFIYYAALIGFIIFGNFIPDKLYLNYTVWLIIVIVSIIPVILNILVKWLFVFYDLLSYWFGNLPIKDVYTNLGNPNAEKPPPPPSSSMEAGITNMLSSVSAAIPSAISANMTSLISSSG
jgi:hypothetical protein